MVIFCGEDMVNGEREGCKINYFGSFLVIIPGTGQYTTFGPVPDMIAMDVFSGFSYDIQ